MNPSKQLPNANNLIDLGNFGPRANIPAINAHGQSNYDLLAGSRNNLARNPPQSSRTGGATGLTGHSANDGSDVAQLLDMFSMFREAIGTVTKRNTNLNPQARDMATEMDRVLAGALGLNSARTLTNDLPTPRDSFTPRTDPNDSDSSDNSEPNRARRVRFVQPNSSSTSSMRAPAAPLPQANTGSLSAVDILQLFSRLDNRSVPKPERYTYSGGRNLEQFLLQFQQYCEGTFRGDSSLWVGELSSLLTGEIREVLDSIWSYGMSFCDVRKELLSWASTQEKHRDQDARNTFNAARLRQNESLGRFCLRLEALFKTAYPRKVTYMENSSTLRRKLLESVGADFRAEVRTAELVHESLAQFGQTQWSQSQDHELSWSAIKALAARYDNNVKVDESAREVWRANQQEAWPVGCHTQETNSRANNQFRGWDIHPDAVGDFDFWVTQPVTDRSRPRQRRSSVSAVSPCSLLTGANNAPMGQRAPNMDSPIGSRGRSTGKQPGAGGYQTRSYSAPRHGRTGQNCSFCRRPNHTVENCRRRRRECLYCASPNHFVRDCELAAARFRWTPPAEFSSGPNQNQPRPVGEHGQNRSEHPAPLDHVIVHAPGQGLLN